MSEGRFPGTYNSQTTSIADSRCELGISNPLHATLDNRDYRVLVSDTLLINGAGIRVSVPVMPSFFVKSVLKGILLGRLCSHNNHRLLNRSRKPRMLSSFNGRTKGEAP